MLKRPPSPATPPPVCSFAPLFALSLSLSLSLYRLSDDHGSGPILPGISAAAGGGRPGGCRDLEQPRPECGELPLLRAAATAARRSFTSVARAGGALGGVGMEWWGRIVGIRRRQDLPRCVRLLDRGPERPKDVEVRRHCLEPGPRPRGGLRSVPPRLPRLATLAVAHGPAFHCFLAERPVGQTLVPVDGPDLPPGGTPSDVERFLHVRNATKGTSLPGSGRARGPLLLGRLAGDGALFGAVVAPPEGCLLRRMFRGFLGALRLPCVPLGPAERIEVPMGWI